MGETAGELPPPLFEGELGPPEDGVPEPPDEGFPEPPEDGVPEPPDDGVPEPPEDGGLFLGGAARTAATSLEGVLASLSSEGSEVFDSALTAFTFTEYLLVFVRSLNVYIKPVVVTGDRETASPMNNWIM